ncbi:MAG: DMT family transporter [Lysobacteraceae bacterium]|nr:MAG: DMT family transporter [Xanthomonadaceae bacterium]
MNVFGAMLVAVLIGAVLPLQGLINARLGTHIGGPVAAAFVSFLVGTAMLGAYLVATRTPLALQGSLKLPAWVWAGGAFGAIYVACFTLLVPRIGAAGMICLAVLGQVTASLLLDQFGILQAPRLVDAVRVAGALLVLAGVVLVVAPWRTPAKPATPVQATPGQPR